MGESASLVVDQPHLQVRLLRYDETSNTYCTTYEESLPAMKPFGVITAIPHASCLCAIRSPSLQGQGTKERERETELPTRSTATTR